MEQNEIKKIGIVIQNLKSQKKYFIKTITTEGKEYLDLNECFSIEFGEQTNVDSSIPNDIFSWGSL